jgi:putative heme degradation protein
VALLAFGAQTAALRIQALLAPHIAEESDTKMDAMEARMTADDQEVRKDLDGLAALPSFTGDADLAAARSAYERFSRVRAKIIPLSRENTNVRSLAISLDQKRKVMFLCQDALASLQQAILEEPIPGVNYGIPSSPR